VECRLFSLLAAAIVATCCRLWRSERPGGGRIGFITGGAVGNVIDRLRLGAVTDFLDFTGATGISPPSICGFGHTVGVSLWLDAARRRESPN